MIDTHCHLDLEEFSADLPEVISRATHTGVSHFLLPAVDVVSCRKIIKLVKKYSGLILMAAGIHPNYASQSSFCQLTDFIKSNLGQINAIGEIGLDFYRTFSDKNDQISLLIQCLKIARENDLPICLHNRNADSELIKILNDWYTPGDKNKCTPHGVFHAYGGSVKVAEWGLEHNFLFGIGGLITYKKNSGLRTTIKNIGLNNLVLETDSPYLSPVPLRGKRNTPENLVHIVNKLSEIFQKSSNEIENITDRNASRLIGLKIENAT